MSLEQLQQIADQAGVGHRDLDEEDLRKKLLFEGLPL